MCCWVHSQTSAMKRCRCSRLLASHPALHAACSKCSSAAAPDTQVCGPAGHNAGACLYVSGVPGTGKTATVRQVVAELRGRVREGDLPNFTFVDINSLRLASPKHVYTHLHEVRVLGESSCCWHIQWWASPDGPS